MPQIGQHNQNPSYYLLHYLKYKQKGTLKSKNDQKLMSLEVSPSLN